MDRKFGYMRTNSIDRQTLQAKKALGIKRSIPESGFADFLLMANDPIGTTPVLMDFDGFPEINIYAFLGFMLSIVVVSVVSRGVE